MRYIITHIIFAIFVLIGAVFSDSFLTGSAIIVAYVVIIIASTHLENEDNDFIGAVWMVTGLILFAIPFVSLTVGVRVLSEGDKIKVVSSMYPIGRVLVTGTKIETLHQQPLGFEDDGHGVEVRVGDLYLIRGDDGEMMTLLTDHSVVACGKKLTLQQRYFRHGWIITCTYLDADEKLNIVDIDGKDIRTKGYTPRIVDTSPTIDYYY